jgi:hypothetical protein
MDAPSSESAEIVNLSVSVTGDFSDTEDSEPFRFYENPVVTALYPHYGPKDGETVIQVWGQNFLNFGEMTRCNFGSKSVTMQYKSPTYGICVAPQSDTVGVSIPFSISLNVQ